MDAEHIVAMTATPETLESLHARVEARTGSHVSSDRWAAHDAVLSRLAANIRVAETNGWVSCAIERVDDAARFRGWGMRPGDSERRPVPDWLTEPDGHERECGEVATREDRSPTRRAA